MTTDSARAGDDVTARDDSPTGDCPMSYADWTGGLWSMGTFQPCPTCGQRTFIGVSHGQPNGYWTHHARRTDA